MNPHSIIIFLDDEPSEHLLMRTALEHLGHGNRMISFYNGQDALEFIKNCDKHIFLILSDLNMPKMNGLELKRIIDGTPELRLKAIPFIFHSSSANPLEIKEAYSLNIQGYFRKHADVTQTMDCLAVIISFWEQCVHPDQLR